MGEGCESERERASDGEIDRERERERGGERGERVVCVHKLCIDRETMLMLLEIGL